MDQLCYSRLFNAYFCFQPLQGNPPPAPSASCPFTPEDISGDGVVSVLDVIALTSTILGSNQLAEGTFCAGDIDSNGIINVSDIIVIIGVVIG